MPGVRLPLLEALAEYRISPGGVVSHTNSTRRGITSIPSWWLEYCTVKTFPRPGPLGMTAATTSWSGSSLAPATSRLRELRRGSLAHPQAGEYAETSTMAKAFETSADTTISALYVSRVTPLRTAPMLVTHRPHRTTQTTRLWATESLKSSDSHIAFKYTYIY